MKTHYDYSTDLFVFKTRECFISKYLYCGFWEYPDNLLYGWCYMPHKIF